MLIHCFLFISIFLLFATICIHKWELICHAKHRQRFAERRQKSELLTTLSPKNNCNCKLDILMSSQNRTTRYEHNKHYYWKCKFFKQQQKTKIAQNKSAYYFLHVARTTRIVDQRAHVNAHNKNSNKLDFWSWNIKEKYCNQFVGRRRDKCVLYSKSNR